MSVLTIFTPTYNRGKLLEQLYESLLLQNNKDFTWLVIDDGSTDNTKDIIKNMINDRKVDIRYVFQENGGKHRAFNRAIDIFDTEIFICVDSDDYLTNDAVDKIINRYNSIKYDDDICGIAGLCIDKSGKILGGKYPEEGLISDTMNIRDIYRLPGEPEIYKSRYLKQYRFEEFENEKFLTEAMLFDKITSQKKIKYFNDVLMVKEYLEGGLTDNNLKIRVNSINGTKSYYKQRIKLSDRKIAKVKACINYSRFCIHGKTIRETFDTSEKVLSLITLPIGLLMYIKDSI